MNNMLSKLALGTVQFGLDYGIANQRGKIAQSEAELIINLARKHGVKTLDTAINYGNCEAQLGNIGMNDWHVITKLPAMPDNCYDISAWVHDQVMGSLSRLKIPQLRGLLLHRPQQLFENNGERLYQSLLSLKELGLVEKIGVSIYDPKELESITQYFQFDLVQAPFNVLDRRLITSGWMDRLAQMNIELHARSVFLQGLLLMPNLARPSKFNRWQLIWQAWQQWLCEVHLLPVQACLMDALGQSGISRVVVGVDGLDQFTEILSSQTNNIHKLPDELNCEDIDLINPARWNDL